MDRIAQEWRQKRVPVKETGEDKTRMRPCQPGDPHKWGTNGYSIGILGFAGRERAMHSLRWSADASSAKMLDLTRGEREVT